MHSAAILSLLVAQYGIIWLWLDDITALGSGFFSVTILIVGNLGIFVWPEHWLHEAKNVSFWFVYLSMVIDGFVQPCHRSVAIDFLCYTVPPIGGNRLFAAINATDWSVSIASSLRKRRDNCMPDHSAYGLPSEFFIILPTYVGESIVKVWKFFLDRLSRCNDAVLMLLSVHIGEQSK